MRFGLQFEFAMVDNIRESQGQMEFLILNFDAWFKNFAEVLRQKANLSQAAFPSFRVIAQWSGVVMFAIVMSAVANVTLVKYIFFPSINATKTSRAKEPVAGLITVADRPKYDDFKVIWTRNLFNSEQVDEAVKETVSESVCQPVAADLPLKFTGVIFGGTKETSLVLLESTATKQSDTFLLNDSVPGDAKIVDITRDRVFFLGPGRSCPEFLELQQPPPPKRRVPNLARSRQDRGGPVSDTQFEFTESGFARARDGNIVADRRWVDKALGTDMVKTLQDAKASPHVVNGEVKGFVLTRIRPDSVYEKMGFQDGDVVEQINGIDLNDAGRAIQTLNSLRNENAIELMVKRNGVAVPLKIQVK